MSQTTFPFVPEQQQEGPAPEKSAPGSRRTLLIVVGGAVLAVVVGIAAWLLFFAGGAEESSGPVVTKKVRAGAPSAPAKVNPKPSALPSAFEGNTGRNPFKPLIATAAPASDPSPGTGPVGSTAPVAPVAPVAGSTPQPPQAPATTQPVSALKFTVVSVPANNATATVKVGATQYVVKRGDTFATYFKMLNITQGKFITFAYGDIIVTLAEGQSVNFS
jgi:hypothetical protein